MPLPAERMPGDLRSLGSRIAALERALRELRAAPRLAHATLQDGALQLLDTAGNVLAELTTKAGAAVKPGIAAYASDPANPYAALLTLGQLQFGRTDRTYAAPPAITHTADGGADPSTLAASSGYIGNGGAARQARWRLVGPPDGSTQPYMEVYSDTGTCDHRVSGVLTAGSIAFGTINVTITAANTPGSATVSGLNVAGTVFRGYASPSTTVPGSNGSNGVTGVSVTGPTANGCTVWATRQSTTAVTVNWLVIGE